MKTRNILFIAITLILTSCNNNNEKYSDLIIGKYYSITYTEDIKWDDEIPISMTWEYFEEFFPNGTSIEDGTIKFSIYNENGNNIIVEYQYGPATDKWYIKESNLFYENSQNGVSFKFKNTNARNYNEKEAVKYFREFIENDFTDIVKQTLNERENKPCKIIELNENRLVTEDPDGEKIIQKRVSISNNSNEQNNKNNTVYSIGTKIAEGVALSLVAGLTIGDHDLKYSIETSNDKITSEGYTWPIIDVSIPTVSKKLNNPKITFVLLLQQDKTKGTIVGTVKNIKVDGIVEPSLVNMNNTMYAETQEGTVQVKMVDGKLYFVE